MSRRRTLIMGRHQHDAGQRIKTGRLRATMRHPNTRALHAYWSKLRGMEPAPARSAIDPAAIAGLLSDTFILEDIGPADYPFRLAGTRLCHHFGRELKGRNFLGFWAANDIEPIATLMAAVTHDAAAAVLDVAMSNDRGQSTRAEMILLPLRCGPARYDRILGLVAPMERASWLGLHPVVRQSANNLRLIWPDRKDEFGVTPAARPVASRPVPFPLNGRRHHHLVVFDGGRQ
ncbi:PAS domain-containing protein [Kaistia dalseonensis]|uniref:PAS domain-containing protein n=1 Tax=Kaistia dalseonensis TaxID=410840 RepID=A0ABU0HDF9_9HYPH|nr:PAS domain-containing protein [Kaistia dalseonensis]MCX5496931.1 PAS domain-containing protein [Kaistia dalseonensis]MDQ0439556.1 hypothetical protein [Kaistia dalseonensis]